MEPFDLFAWFLGSVFAIVTSKSFIICFFAAALATFLTPFLVKAKDLLSVEMYIEMAMAADAFVSLFLWCLGVFASVHCWTAFSITTGMLAGVGLIYKAFIQPDSRTFSVN